MSAHSRHIKTSFAKANFVKEPMRPEPRPPQPGDIPGQPPKPGDPIPKPPDPNPPVPPSPKSGNPGPRNSLSRNEAHHGVEAAVAVFPNQQLAAEAARALSGTGLQVKEVRHRSGDGNDPPRGLEDLEFENVRHVESTDVVSGIVKSGAIGAVSGLLLIGVPVVGLAAPIGGMLAGALIGGMAGVDEKNRAIEQPDLERYNAMLAEGKSLLVMPGDEEARIEYQKQLYDLGAEHVWQHPPTGETVRDERDKREHRASRSTH
jgi:hypothetical protein